MRVVLVLAGLLVLLLAGPRPAFAEGRVLPEDFTVRGLTLGEAADEARLAAAFGAPLFDTERSVFGVRVRYYTFRGKFSVGVAPRTGEVVDIVIEDETYAARDGVRYGATPHRIAQVYGKKERVRLDGLTWYIYEHPERPGARLMLEAEPGVWMLVSWRLTTLPLTEAEADRRADGDEDWQSADLAARMIDGREADMSALEARSRGREETGAPWKK